MGRRLVFRPCDDGRVLADWTGLSGLARLDARVMRDGDPKRRSAVALVQKVELVRRDG